MLRFGRHKQLALAFGIGLITLAFLSGIAAAFGLRINTSYYNIKYEDRIDVIPNTALSTPAQYAPYITRNPSVALAVRWGRVLMTPRVFRWVNLGCSAALLVFGVALAVAMLGQV